MKDFIKENSEGLALLTLFLVATILLIALGFYAVNTNHEYKMTALTVHSTNKHCAVCAAICAVNPAECADCWKKHHCGPEVGLSGDPQDIVQAWNLAKEAQGTADNRKDHHEDDFDKCQGEWNTARDKMTESKEYADRAGVLDNPLDNNDGSVKTLRGAYGAWDYWSNESYHYCDTDNARHAAIQAFHIVRTLSTACEEC